jgi:hypothetical protein
MHRPFGERGWLVLSAKESMETLGHFLVQPKGVVSVPVMSQSGNRFIGVVICDPPAIPFKTNVNLVVVFVRQTMFSLEEVLEKS